MEDRSPQLYAVTITVLALVWISAALRYHVRAHIVKSFGVDDWLFLLSALTFSMYCSFVLVGLHYGTGRHAWDLEEANMLKGIRYWYFCEWSYAISATAMKVAIGAFFLRIAVEVLHIRIIWAIILVNVLFGFSYFMCAVLQCVPIPYIWKKYAANPPPPSSAKCISEEFQVWGSIAHSALCAASDWTLALLPIAMLWGTTLNNRTRATVYFLMGLGALSSTATLVRISYLHTVKTKTDFLWVTFDVAIWSTVEGVGIVANGLATLRPLFRAILSSKTTHGSSSNNYNLDSNPLSTLSSSGKKEKRIHTFSRLSCDDLSSDDVNNNNQGRAGHAPTTGKLNVNLKEVNIENQLKTIEAFSGRGRSGLDSWDINETSNWRPDSHKLGKFTTTVVGGGPNAYLNEDDAKTASRSRSRSRESRRKSTRPKIPTRGITMVKEFSIEDRKARFSELAGTSIEMAPQNRARSEDAVQRYQS